MVIMFLIFFRFMAFMTSANESMEMLMPGGTALMYLTI